MEEKITKAEEGHGEGPSPMEPLLPRPSAMEVEELTQEQEAFEQEGEDEHFPRIHYRPRIQRFYQRLEPLMAVGIAVLVIATWTLDTNNVDCYSEMILVATVACQGVTLVWRLQAMGGISNQQIGMGAIVICQLVVLSLLVEALGWLVLWIVTFSIASIVLDKHIETRANKSSRTKQLGVFAELVKGISRNVKSGRHCTEGTPKEAVSYEPPLHGFYLPTIDLANRNMWKTSLAALNMTFHPNGDNGWEIRGCRKNADQVRDGQDVKGTVIYEGYVSNTNEAYWVEGPPDQSAMTLYYGHFRSPTHFWGSWVKLKGERSSSFSIVAISETDCPSHFWVTCQSCHITPIVGTRYTAQGYDLCEECIEKFEGILEGDNPPPVSAKEAMQAIVTPFQSPDGYVAPDFIG